MKTEVELAENFLGIKDNERQWTCLTGKRYNVG